ncbi:MAG: OadG family protein [Christensenellaceae bacterium]|nr:OadG family protein [Christensenellaceae bacterium]
MDPIVVLITGMCVVFLGIVVLICIVKLMSLGCAVFKHKDKNAGAVSGNRVGAAQSRSNRTELNRPSAAGAHTAVATAGAASVAMPAEKRRELIAVISASIAETMGTNAAGIRIKSIKKL